jgi:hypothetical protein
MGINDWVRHAVEMRDHLMLASSDVARTHYLERREEGRGGRGGGGDGE